MSPATKKQAEKKVIKTTNWAFFIAGQAGIVPVTFGCPGVAKTASCMALAKAAGRPFESFVLQHHLPEDFGGFPVVREIEHNGQKYEMMKRVKDEKLVRAMLTPSVVLFDELTNAGHAIQAAALQLIQDGIPGSWVFAAANPPDLAAAGVELTPPMVNRMCILKWESDPEGWDEGCRNGFNFGAPNVPILPDSWRENCSKWGPLLVEFRQRFPELWEKPPKDGGTVGRPFPSPRSWTNAGVLCAAADSVGAPLSVHGELMKGCVGEAESAVFWRWMTDMDLPDPESILSNPGSLNLPKRGDMALSILSSVVCRIRESNTPARWEAGRQVLSVAWGQSQEAAMVMDGALWALKPEGHNPKNVPALKELNDMRLAFSNNE